MQPAVPFPLADLAIGFRLRSAAVAGSMAFWGVMLASLVFFFRHALLTGLNTLYGDSYDGMIEIAILEHWFRVFAHGEPWAATGWFHPFPATLGYNDTYLLPGLPYTLARLAGADPFIAAFASHVAMKAIGFGGMFVLLSRGLDASRTAALFGATLFTTPNATLLHMNHAQLLSIALVPWLAWTAGSAAQAMVDGRRTALNRHGGAFALLFGLTAFTAFYAAWFFAFFAMLFTAAGLRFAGRERRAALFAGARRQLGPLLLLSAALILVLTPFLLLYLPKVAEGAKHGWEGGAGFYAPDTWTFLNVGEGNLIWGRVSRALIESMTGAPPALGEARVGLPFGLAAALITAVAWSVKHRAKQPVMVALAFALQALAVLLLRWPNGFSYWWFVYRLIPGADAVRVVSRLLIFALVPAIALVATYLDRTVRSPIAAVLAGGFLLAEQVQLAPPLMLDLAPQRRMLAAGPPPSDCRSFFVVSARPADEQLAADPEAITALWGDVDSGRLFDTYRHNVDAMLLASHYGRATVNGFSTFNPPGWDFARPDDPDYIGRIRHYAAAHGLKGLCGLDRRRARSWFTLDQARAARTS